jgi:Pentapeptide repeats (9 copies)
MGDADKRGSDAGEQTPPKIKAEDNPWYLLATLHGVPEPLDYKLQEKNRIAWNRYFAANLDEEMQTKLIALLRTAEGKVKKIAGRSQRRRPRLAEELTPATPGQLREIAAAFVKRCKAAAKEFALPATGARIDFTYVEFEQVAYFGGYLFSKNTSFHGAAFSDYADFAGAAFSGRASFTGAAFSGDADFDGAAFSGRATFGGATFSLWATFGGAAFSGRANFDSAIFSHWADFAHAAFSSEATFADATFSLEATFGGAAFSGRANFDRATFSLWADFENATFGQESTFVNAEMKDKTSFKGTTFKTKPPEFFNTKLHPGTDWRGNKPWPKPKNKLEAGQFINAYACLKLEMDRLKKHEEELDFFALELQSRRVEQGPWRGWPIALYGLVSDYGCSYARPFLWLLAVAAIGGLLLLFSDALPAEKSFGFSAASTLNVFGFRKDFFDAATIECLPASLKILAALQTILGTILLFLFGLGLFGLGIRNKFRMK